MTAILWFMMWEVIFAIRYFVVVANYQCHLLCSEGIANPQMLNIIALLQAFDDQSKQDIAYDVFRM